MGRLSRKLLTKLSAKLLAKLSPSFWWSFSLGEPTAFGGALAFGEALALAKLLVKFNALAKLNIGRRWGWGGGAAPNRTELLGGRGQGRREGGPTVAKAFEKFGRKVARMGGGVGWVEGSFCCIPRRAVKKSEMAAVGFVRWFVDVSRIFFLHLGLVEVDGVRCE